MPSSSKRFEIMVTTTLKKNHGPSMLKHNDDYSCIQEDQYSRKQRALFCVLSYRCYE